MSDRATWEKLEGSRDAKPRAGSSPASATNSFSYCERDDLERRVTAGETAS